MNNNNWRDITLHPPPIMTPVLAWFPLEKRTLVGVYCGVTLGWKVQSPKNKYEMVKSLHHPTHWKYMNLPGE